MEFTDLCVIGEGAYGKVYKATHCKTNQQVALKQVRIDKILEGVPCTTIREVAILSTFKHQNIVRLLFSYHNSQFLTLVFEYCPTDLHRFMKTKRLTTLEIVSFSYQLLSAVSVLHAQSIIHRDIKPHNLLIKDSVLKLADFGLSRTMNIPHSRLSVDVVTLWYRPPEILMKCNDYSIASDMWSCGCVIAEMALGRPIFQGKDETTQLAKIAEILGISNDYPHMQTVCGAVKSEQTLRSILEDVDEHVVLLIESLLQTSPEKRSTAQQALKSQIFQRAEITRYTHKN